MHQVCLQGERERDIWRERERGGGGALSLEDAVATWSLHVRLFPHPKLSQQTSAAPSISRGNA